MATADDVPDAADGPVSDPRPLLYIGAGLALAGFLVFRVPELLGLWEWTGSFSTFLRAALLVVGALLTGGAVTVRPKSAPQLFAAAVVAWFVGNALSPDWDSARLVMLVLTGVALVAAFLVGLPFLTGRAFVAYTFLVPGRTAAEAEERGRFAGLVLSRVVVSVLVVLHFLGIVACVLAPSAAGRESSWLAQWVWGTWQPYMQFAYLNNSYRFYSPEPGPPMLLWFYVEYRDGSGRWVKLPSRAEHAYDPLAQEFTRRLTLGESINQIAPLPPSAIERKNRVAAGNYHGIPLHPEMPLEQQYQLPTRHRTLSEYARFVAQHSPHDDPSIPVSSVKMYRVVHKMLEPKQMASGKFTPTEPWTYLPYYQGEYTPDGELKNPSDPYLFWLIPIYAWPTGVPLREARSPEEFVPTVPLPLENYPRLDIHDGLEKHARLREAEGR